MFGKPQCERWVQETLESILKYRETVRNPFAYAVGTLDHLIRKAIRENKKARAETDVQDGQPIAPDISPEENLLAKDRRIFEGLVAMRLKECLLSVVSKMPLKPKQLFLEYYELEKHDRRSREFLVTKYRLKTYNNLQVRIHRIGQAVTSRVMECMGESGSRLHDLDESQRRKLIRNYVRELLNS